jgi:hypothetical protein
VTPLLCSKRLPPQALLGREGGSHTQCVTSALYKTAFVSSPSWRRVLVPISSPVRAIGSNRLFFEILVLTSSPARVIGSSCLFFKVFCANLFTSESYRLKLFVLQGSKVFLVPVSSPVRVIDLNRLFFKAAGLPLALGCTSFCVLSTLGIRSCPRKVQVSSRMGEP